MNLRQLRHKHLKTVRVSGENWRKNRPSLPRPSMGLVYLPTFGWFFMLNVGKYTIYGHSISGAFFSSILQRIQRRLANGSQKQPRKCEQKTRQWRARHGFLIWFKFSNGQEGSKAFCFHHYLGSFMIQFDDCEYFCGWVGEKLPSSLWNNPCITG